MMATGIFSIVAFYSIGLDYLNAAQISNITCQGVGESCSVHSNELNCYSRTITLQQDFPKLWSDELHSFITADVKIDGELPGKCSFSSKFFKNQETVFDCYFQTVKDNLELNYQHFSPHSCNCSCKIRHLKPIKDKFFNEVEETEESTICKKGISPPAVSPEIERREIGIFLNLTEEKLRKCDLHFELFHVSGSSLNCSKVSQTDDPRVDKIKIQNRNQPPGKLISCKFENVTAPARYCVLIFSHLQNDQCKECLWTTEVISFESKGNSSSASVINADTNVLPSVVLSVLSGILAGVVLLLGFIYLRRRRSSGSFIESSNHNDIEIGKVCQNHEALQELSVFLIYSDECKQHARTVHALAEFLQKNCKCKVSYDQLQPNEVHEDPFNWMVEKITNSDKVIIVTSEGAYYKAQSLKNKQLASWDSEFSSIFLQCIAYLNDKPEFRGNYSKFVNIRFSYTGEDYNLDTVASNTIYEIPKFLKDFCCHLHEPNPDKMSTYYARENFWVKGDYGSYHRLIKAIKETERYLRKNPICNPRPILDNQHKQKGERYFL